MVNVYLVYDGKEYNGVCPYDDLVSEQSLKALKGLEPNINYLPYSVSDSDHLSEGILKIKKENPQAKIAVLIKLDTCRVAEHVPPSVKENSEKGLVDLFIFTQDKQSTQPIMKPDWIPEMLQIIHWKGGLEAGGGQPLSKRIIGQTPKRAFKKLLEESKPASEPVANQEPQPEPEPEPASTTESEQNETMLQDMNAQLKSLLQLCQGYKRHLEPSLANNPELLTVKKHKIVSELLLALTDPTIEDSASKIQNMEKLLTAENKATLSCHRDSVGVRFLNAILHVLSFGLFSKMSKGTFAFWKSHGEAMVDEVEVLSKKPSSRSSHN